MGHPRNCVTVFNIKSSERCIHGSGSGCQMPNSLPHKGSSQMTVHIKIYISSQMAVLINQVCFLLGTEFLTTLPLTEEGCLRLSNYSELHVW